jgi:protein-L-isoaspartate(D-aspartate) O-methyltransferase
MSMRLIPNIEQARFNMIEQQIRPWDVLDTAVLNLLKQVKREQFVPPVYASVAFSDTELPLGHGQTMLSPKLEARLLQTAQMHASDRVLEIGTGSGYMAALMGFTAAQVVSFELEMDLATAAKSSLHSALLDNVTVVTGCGFAGGVAQAGERGWDLIMLSGSVPSATSIPAALLATLTIGGRLLAVVGDAHINPMMQVQLIKRTSADSFNTELLFNANAPALRGVSSTAFTF